MSLYTFARDRLRTTIMGAALVAHSPRLFRKSADRSNDRPLAGEPDWLVGCAIHAYHASHHPAARLLYAQALAEWTLRKVEQKMPPFELWRLVVPPALHGSQFALLPKDGMALTGVHRVLADGSFELAVRIPTGSELKVIEGVRAERIK